MNFDFDALTESLSAINSILFSNVVVLVLLAVGILFTLWSGFGQYRALTHGVSVVRGKYDDKDDPGAINHFQALSTALSATVGLGNIAGVALAVALGGPGAVFWMWIIGILGMALKMTEVTQSMLYRNTDDPDNPHGGPMFVVAKGFKEWGLGPIGAAIGAIFVITLLASTVTGGNMFQAWAVADVTHTYLGTPQIATGTVLAILVGLVIIGGIKRIGAVAGRIVPFMCLLYVLAAAYVLLSNITDIPAMLALIFSSAFSTANPEGAFIGGTLGSAAAWGVKRALFSSEAGQGSAPIAHSAAKTKEPVREGVVAGLEPFIDTIVVCTVTALVILSSGAFNRSGEAFVQPQSVQIIPLDVTGPDGQPDGIQDTNRDNVPLWTATTQALPRKTAEARRILQTAEGRAGWRNNESVFIVLEADLNEDPDSNISTKTDTGTNLVRLSGTVTREDDDQPWLATWKEVASYSEPVPRLEQAPLPSDAPEGATPPMQNAIYSDYAGASLTAHAFDRVQPGLGRWLVLLAAWLFAISTMISWSYYGEQGIYYLAGNLSKSIKDAAILVYKLVYCFLIFLTTVLASPIFPSDSGVARAIISTDKELDAWTSLGLGVMLWANIPIMLIFGAKAMKAYHAYIKRLRDNEYAPHETPPFKDVVEGKDVE